MTSLLNRQKQLAEQSRLLREKQRSIPIPPRPPKVPIGPLEAVNISPEGIAIGRPRQTVKIGSKRKMKKKATRRNNGQRTTKNKKGK